MKWSESSELLWSDRTDTAMSLLVILVWLDNIVERAVSKMRYCAGYLIWARPLLVKGVAVLLPIIDFSGNLHGKEPGAGACLTHTPELVV